MTQDYAQLAMHRRDLTKASEMLLGLVTGIVADQQLHDLEIKLLSTWIADNHVVTTAWPGSVLAQKLQEILADGIITEDERAHLMDTLRSFSITSFAETGSATPEVLKLPIDDSAPVRLRNATVCLTGEFLYGTRLACQYLSARAGASVIDTVTRKLTHLVIGTNVSPHWANTSYGRKIQKAVELQQNGVPIRIISEKCWLEAANTATG